MFKLKKTLPFFIALILLMAGHSLSFAQGIIFVHDLDSALTLAKAQNKPIFIDFYTSWCGPCKVMSNEVFPNEKVGNFFNKEFINCKIQCDDNGKGVEDGKKYQVYAYPTLMFLNSNGELIHSAAGSYPIDQFIDIAKIALNPEKNLMSLITKWDNGQRDTAFVNSYFNALTSAYRVDLAKNQFQNYFDALNKTEKTSKNTFELIKLLGFPPFSPIFSFVEDNKESFYKSTGATTINKYISDVYKWSLKAMAMNTKPADHQKYLEAKARFKAKKYPNSNEIIKFIEIFETFDSTGHLDIKEYQRRGTAFLNLYGTKDDAYTLALVSLLGNCTGKKDEGVAGIQWMENLLSRNNKPEYLNTYFYILWRNFHFDKALEIAKEIRNNEIRNNESTKDIDGQVAMINKYRAKLAERKVEGK